MNVRSFPVAAVAIALLTCLGGCGGSSSPSSAPATSTVGPSATKAEPTGGATRAAYVEEADAVCRATDEVTAPVASELAARTSAGKPRTPREEAELGELIARIVFIAREEEQEIASIQAPAADAAIVKRWIDAGQEGLGDLEAAALALERKNSAKFEEQYAEATASLERAGGIARDYGLKVCGAEVQTIR